MAAEDLEGTLRSILVEEFRVDPEKVVAGASFKEDMELDSLDLVQLAMTLEDRFDVEIPEEDLEGVATIDQALDLLERKVGARA